MKKNYRLTIDFKIDINEKVKVPGNMTDNGECTPAILEKSRHVMDAFFKEPGVKHEFIKHRVFYRIHSSDHTKETKAKFLGLLADEEL